MSPLVFSFSPFPQFSKSQAFLQLGWRIDIDATVVDMKFCTHKSIPYRLFFTFTVLHRFLHLPVAEGKAVFEKPLITCLAAGCLVPTLYPAAMQKAT